MGLPEILFFLFLASGCSPGGTSATGAGVPLGTVNDKQLTEISGIAASRRTPGILWVHNDGSDERLFALNTNGLVVAVFRLQTTVTDVEDIAVGPGGASREPHVYVGDIGDNEVTRGSIRVYRFPEPEIASASRSKKPLPIPRFETITLRYSDGPHDAEALLVDSQSGDLLVVTKQARRARIYGAASNRWQDAAPVTLNLVTEIAFGDVSGGDISSDGHDIILRRENAARIWTRRPGESLASALMRTPQPAPVIGPPREPNGEAITFHPGGGGYFTLSEGKRQPVYFFPRINTPLESQRK